MQIRYINEGKQHGRATTEVSTYINTRMIGSIRELIGTNWKVVDIDHAENEVEE